MTSRRTEASRGDWHRQAHVVSVFIRTQMVGFQFWFGKALPPAQALLSEAWEHVSSPLGRPCLQKTGELVAASSVCKHGVIMIIVIVRGFIVFAVSFDHQRRELPPRVK